MGLRYRVNVRPLPSLRRTADLVFTRQRIAVFIDGCFWHGCTEHHRQPHANADYWTAKVQRNRQRDRTTDEALRAAGWEVLRFWEHMAPGEVAETVRAAVASRPEQSKNTTV
jgi:DNA mismatch endonuclease (patch repair protein)